MGASRSRPRRAKGPREKRKAALAGRGKPAKRRRGAALGLLDSDARHRVRVPHGAIAADVKKQRYGIGGPLAYYKDRRRSCVACGDGFVFSALEQKHWYEELGFVLNSKAVRCPKCRRARRSDRAVMRRLADAKARVRAAPEDGPAWLELAEAIWAHHERLGHPNPSEGVAAARRALRLAPRLHEALYWEGACHAAAGRVAKAKALWLRFLDVAAGVSRRRALVQRARAAL